MILEHTLERPDGLIDCATVLDVGAGVRPFQWYRPERHICVEPYGQYCDILRWHGYEVLQMTADEALANQRAEGVLMLDVIEHMEKDLARRVLALARDAASRQVVVYTPLGFMVQESDAWGYDGHEWQRHRSGWTPEDLPGWTIQVQESRRGFFALWTK